MDVSETLVGIAQLGIALAGFAGVALALSSPANWTPGDRYRIWLLLSLSLPQIPFALLPVVLLHALPELAWRVASAPLVAYWLIFFGLIRRRLRRYREHEEFPIMSRRSWGLVVTPVSLAVSVLLCLNVASWPFESGPAAYLLALVWGLSWGAAVFADIIFVRPGRS